MTRQVYSEKKGIPPGLSPAGSARSMLRAFMTSLILLRDPRLIVPALISFVLQIAAMPLYIYSPGEPWLPLWALLAGGHAGTALGHYPQHLLLMPHVLGRFDIIMDIFVHSIFQGATVLMVASAFRKEDFGLGPSLFSPFRRYAHLLGVAAISSASVFAVINISEEAATSLQGTASTAVSFAGVAAGLVIQALFLYAVPLIMLDRKSFGGMLAEDLRLFARAPLLSFFIVAVPFILTLPTMLLSIKADVIAIRLEPSFMIHIQAASSFMEMISTYLISAGAAIIYIRRKDAGPGSERAGSP